MAIPFNIIATETFTTIATNIVAGVNMMMSMVVMMMTTVTMMMMIIIILRVDNVFVIAWKIMNAVTVFMMIIIQRVLSLGDAL